MEAQRHPRIRTLLQGTVAFVLIVICGGTLGALVKMVVWEFLGDLVCWFVLVSGFLWYFYRQRR
jgi:hypothetical protein